MVIHEISVKRINSLFSSYFDANSLFFTLSIMESGQNAYFFWTFVA